MSKRGNFSGMPDEKPPTDNVTLDSGWRVRPVFRGKAIQPRGRWWRMRRRASCSASAPTSLPWSWLDGRPVIDRATEGAGSGDAVDAMVQWEAMHRPHRRSEWAGWSRWRHPGVRRARRAMAERPESGTEVPAPPGHPQLLGEALRFREGGIRRSSTSSPRNTTPATVGPGPREDDK